MNTEGFGDIGMQFQNSPVNAPITNVHISTIYGPRSYFREFSDAMRVVGVLWAHRSGVLKKHVPRPVEPGGES